MDIPLWEWEVGAVSLTLFQKRLMDEANLNALFLYLKIHHYSNNLRFAFNGKYLLIVGEPPNTPKALNPVRYIIQPEKEWQMAGETRTLNVPESGAKRVTAIAISEDGESGATGYEDGTVRLWDLEMRKPHDIQLMAGNQITHMAYVSDQTKLVVCNEAGNITTLAAVMVGSTFLWSQSTIINLKTPLHDFASLIPNIVIFTSDAGVSLVRAGDKHEPESKTRSAIQVLWYEKPWRNPGKLVAVQSTEENGDRVMWASVARGTDRTSSIGLWKNPNTRDKTERWGDVIGKAVRLMLMVEPDRSVSVLVLSDLDGGSKMKLSILKENEDTGFTLVEVKSREFPFSSSELAMTLLHNRVLALFVWTQGEGGPCLRCEKVAIDDL